MKHQRWSFPGALLLGLSASIATAVTIPVTNTLDSGPGSLRQAITDANLTPAADTITFNIPGTGVQTIAPASALPMITQPVTIDGYTQAGATPNTNGPGLGLNTVLMIEIDCTNAGSYCLNVSASDTTIRGLVMNRAPSMVIQLLSGTNDKVEGCFLGTNPAGTAAFSGKDFWSINIVGQTNTTIGGTTPAARNLLNASLRGIEIGDSPNTGHLIQGNLIGTNAAGTAAIAATGGFGIALRAITSSTIGGLTPAEGNVISGISSGILLGYSLGATGVSNIGVFGNFVGTDVTGTKVIGNSQLGIAAYDRNNTIGGTAPGAGNVIAGSGSNAGVYIVGGSGTIVHGNFIGTDPTGTLDLGNTRVGVDVEADNCVIGGLNPGEGNLIGFNGGASGFSAGVTVYGQHAKIRGNRIYATKSGTNIDGLAIDLVNGSLGVNPNDLGDGDTGPNGLQNFPIITGVTYGASTTTVQGILNSAPGTTYDLDFYADPPCSPRPQAWVGGNTILGTIPVTTDGSGNATFNTVLPVAVVSGSRVTASATDPLGNTSEFSQRIIFSTSFKAGPPSGGTATTLTGMLFQDPATVTIGGVPATGVTVLDANTITATVPPLPPGTVNAITVTTGGLTGTLADAWVVYFSDVPSTNPVYSFVDKLVGNAITAGCGGGNYCPTTPVNRAQMAVFLLRGFLGLCYVPPPATGTVFTDVASNSFAAAYIEALAAAQVTGGCGGGAYCPSSPVTRAQMAVFLLRTLQGPTYVPPACTTATFNDVPCSSGFSPWIYELVRRNITAGCGSGNYCPNDSVTRGQMAVFISTMFGLP